jgi:hypothetical protein
MNPGFAMTNGSIAVIARSRIFSAVTKQSLLSVLLGFQWLRFFPPFVKGVAGFIGRGFRFRACVPKLELGNENIIKRAWERD